MAKMFLMEVDKEGRKVEVNGLDDMYKFIECTCIDSVSLFYTDTGRICATVDDEGLLTNKKRNRGFLGNILISKVNDDGEDIDISDEEIEKVIEKLDHQPKCNSLIINNFVNNIDYFLKEPILNSFDFDDINLYVTVSSNDILNAICSLKNKETIELIESFISTLYLGEITIEEFFKTLAVSHAEAVYQETKSNSFYRSFLS